ncbi:MAG: hypothetical protein GY913_29710 [Proteobacteria bacterium]|nr:hypothetical protein [Pseudomonadota bacterium]MCP4921092.1 hypothetical protein [Pseudomonadota bacterium]
MRCRLVLAATLGALLALSPEAYEDETSEVESGPLFGFWGLNGFWETDALNQLQTLTGLTLYQVACADPAIALSTLLPQARLAGVKMTLRMAGDHDRYTREGAFDVRAWKVQLGPWAGSGVQEFVDDGTLVGHMLLDDIHNFPEGGPIAAELEEMARYTGSLMPGLMTYVRERATEMPEPESGTYTQVDACVNQYKAMDGPVQEWADEQAERSRELDLGIINGLNLCDGGDGSSEQPGWRKDRYAMTGDEIREYGRVLAQVEGMGMFLNWEYDDEERWSDGSLGTAWLTRREQEEALRDIGDLVGSRPHVQLLRSP